MFLSPVAEDRWSLQVPLAEQFLGLPGSEAAWHQNCARNWLAALVISLWIARCQCLDRPPGPPTPWGYRSTPPQTFAEGVNEAGHHNLLSYLPTMHFCLECPSPVVRLHLGGLSLPLWEAFPGTCQIQLGETFMPPLASDVSLHGEQQWRMLCLLTFMSVLPTGPRAPRGEGCFLLILGQAVDIETVLVQPLARMSQITYFCPLSHLFPLWDEFP